MLLVRSAFYRQEAARLLLEKGTPLAAAGEYGYAARLFTRSAKLGFVMDQRVEGREVQAVEYYSLIAGFFRSAEIYNRGEKFDEAMKIGLEGVSAFLNNKWRGDLFSNVKEGELSETPLLELRRSRLNPRTKREMADYLANLIIPYELACRRQGKEARVIGNVHYETVVLLIKRLRAP